MTPADQWMAWFEDYRASLGAENYMSAAISGEFVEIESISIEPRGTGLGTKILRDMCDKADEIGVTLYLEAAASDGVFDQVPWCWTCDEEQAAEGTCEQCGDRITDAMGEDWSDEQVRLEGWYQRHGFEYTGDTGKSGQGGPNMMREPSGIYLHGHT